MTVMEFYCPVCDQRVACVFEDLTADTSRYEYYHSVPVPPCVITLPQRSGAGHPPGRRVWTTSDQDEAGA